jgi:hypothetical protein
MHAGKGTLETRDDSREEMEAARSRRQRKKKGIQQQQA